ncbi:hypothetical protein CsSME_00043789 [Camellia sinensis var. sinensis]
MASPSPRKENIQGPLYTFLDGFHYILLRLTLMGILSQFVRFLIFISCHILGLLETNRLPNFLLISFHLWTLS